MITQKDNPYYKDMRQAWRTLRNDALNRGEAFKLSWNEYYDLWQPDKWLRRGKQPGCYCIRRLDGQKPWSRDNAHITLWSNNRRKQLPPPPTTQPVQINNTMLTDLHNYLVDVEDYRRKLRPQANDCVFLADDRGSVESVTRVKAYAKDPLAKRRFNSINANQVAIRLKYRRYIPGSSQVVASCGDMRCCNPSHIDVPFSPEAPGLKPAGYNTKTRRVNCPTVTYGVDHPVRLALDEFKQNYPNVDIDFDRIRSTYEPHYIIRSQTINNN